MVNGINCTGGVNLAEKKTFIFYSDSGHGWLQVDRKDLRELSLKDKISGYSYQEGNKVYLEEDCDATLFIKAYEEKYGKMDYREVYEEDIFIRRLSYYRR